MTSYIRPIIAKESELNAKELADMLSQNRQFMAGFYGLWRKRVKSIPVRSDLPGYT
jgi:hypothetical protein